MRLTNSIRSAFVKSVMNDTPSVDYTELPNLSIAIKTKK